MATTVAIGSGSAARHLSREEVWQLVEHAIRDLQVRGKRVLTIIPDGTRTMPMPLMFELLQAALVKEKAAASDYIVALGTHRAMDEAQLSAHFGQPVHEGICGSAKVMNHRWDTPETFIELGTISADEVEELSGGLLREEVPVKINRMIFDYDQVLICGPVFPHEVVGFSGGNKYLFPGISGREMIDFTHWLGALLGSYDIIGTGYTPVRAMIDKAASLISAPVACFALVLDGTDISGIYLGSAEDAWRSAAELSSQKHIVWVDRPFKRVLSVMPAMYQDIWTAAKGMYKVEPAIEDDGEVVVFAPHIPEFSYVHGKWIEEIGYHCRDYFLADWNRFAHIPRGILAHSTHLKGKGEFDAVRHLEKPRIQVTLATGISEERCRRANLGYLDPRKINIEEWQRCESEGIKVIPKAGETLYRVRS
jgi:nickel-dependent lactate racemase